MRRRSPLLLLSLIAGLGCSKFGCGKQEPAAPDSKSPAPSSAPVTRTGVLEGVVRLAVGYELPSYRDDQMEKNVLTQADRAPAPEACTPPRTVDRQPVQAAEGGGLSNVVIAPSQFSQRVRRATRVHEVSIADCRLSPKTVLAMKGDVLRVRNTMTYPFMPTYGSDTAVRTLIPGQTYDVALDKPGVRSLLCGFTAPCGRTDVVTLLHPLGTLTGAEGKFRFDEFPADETVQLSAWHPLFEETRLQVKVHAGEHKTVELVLTPRVAVQPAPQQSPATPGAPGGDGKPATPPAPATAPATAPAK